MIFFIQILSFLCERDLEGRVLDLEPVELCEGCPSFEFVGELDESKVLRRHSYIPESQIAYLSPMNLWKQEASTSAVTRGVIP